MAADAFYAQSPTEKKHDERKPLVPNQERYTVTLYMVLHNVLCSVSQGPLAIVRRETSCCHRAQA